MDIASRVATVDMSKAKSNRYERVKAGNHIFGLLEWSERSTEVGAVYSAKLVVVKSDTCKEGEVYETAYFPDNGEGWQRTKAVAQLADFARNVMGFAESQQEELAQKLPATLDKSQPLRGALIKCEGKEVPWKSKKTGKSGIAIELTWEHVPGQTADKIKARRDEYETKFPNAYGLKEVSEHTSHQDSSPAPSAQMLPASSMNLLDGIEL